MLFEPLFKHAERQGQEIAVRDDRGQYSYQQLAAMAAGLGMYLSAQTRQPRVGLLLPSSAAFAASFYGTLLAGKGAVPINFLLGDREVAHIIQDSGVDTVVTIPQLAGRLKDLNLKIVDLAQLPQTPPAIAPKFPSPPADETAVLIYTSGTSGLPKGVELTYGNLQSCVDGAIEHAALKGQHRFLGIVPLFHVLGLVATLLAPIQLGALVLYQARFSPVAAVQAMREHKLSLLFALPTMYAAMLRLKDASPADFAQTYALLSGGEPLPSQVREKWQERFQVQILEGYGLTETCGPITINVPQGHRPGSVGRPVASAQAKIVGDDAKALPVGESGEVWLKGPMVMKGYFNLPDETSNALTADGFLRTGDLGRVDEDGYLYITGRKKDLIIVSGEKVYPREIEETLAQHPSVGEVAVVAKKDASRGEVPVAFVVAREGQTIEPEQLRSFAQDKGLPRWKTPREIFVIPEMPRSPTGKVLKRVLSERLTERQ